MIDNLSTSYGRFRGPSPPDHLPPPSLAVAEAIARRAAAVEAKVLAALDAKFGADDTAERPPPSPEVAAAIAKRHAQIEADAFAARQAATIRSAGKDDLDDDELDDEPSDDYTNDDEQDDDEDLNEDEEEAEGDDEENEDDQDGNKTTASAVQLDALRDRCEAMADKIAPIDTALLPIYVVWAPEANLKFAGAGIGGMWCPDMDLACREAIGGRWRGRGIALIVDPHTAIDVADLTASALARCEEQIRPSDAEGIAQRWILAYTLHELSHELEAEPPDRTRMPAKTRTLTGKVVRGAIRDKLAAPEQSDKPPFHDHEWPFIRAALHVAHRAIEAGYPIQPREVFDTTAYGLRHTTADYLEALGDEPERLSEKSFAKIRAIRAPRAFRELWAGDVAAWEAGNNED